MSIMYTTVPAPMDTSIFRFHRCKPTVTSNAINSGIPYGYDRTTVSLKVYTTSIPITEAGNALPRYSTKSGAFFPGGNTRNAPKRVSNVPATTMATVMTISILVKAHTSPLIRNIGCYEHTTHRSKHKERFTY